MLYAKFSLLLDYFNEQHVEVTVVQTNCFDEVCVFMISFSMAIILQKLNSLRTTSPAHGPKVNMASPAGHLFESSFLCSY